MHNYIMRNNDIFIQNGEIQVVYTPTEAAEKLGLCKTTVLRYIRRGELKARKYGKKIQIDETEIADFKERHSVGTSEAQQ